MNLIHLQEAYCIIKRYFSVKKNGFKKYNGTPEKMCKQIIKNCWNGTFFQVSTGHFRAFYTRDFAYCVEALLWLGYKEQVWKTLQYALHIFTTHKKITTSIVRDTPFDVFHYSPDSLPLLLRSLHKAQSYDLVETYQQFLEEEIKKYVERVINPATGLVLPKKFSSIKDHAFRKSSCYDTAMVGLLKKMLTQLELPNPLQPWDYEKILREYYWNGSYFNDTAESNYVSGDANVFPFWCEVINDATLLKKSMRTITQEGLDAPFPLKYTKNNPNQKYFPFGLLTPNYEGNTVWIHLGLCYCEVVMRVDKNRAQKYLKSYTTLLKKHKTFLEVFNPDETPYETLGYYCDEGMLWCSLYIWLLHKVEK